MAMNCGGWRAARAKAVQHPAGTSVARPANARGCWATTCAGVVDGKQTLPRGCSLRARQGKLTCAAHRDREQQAQVERALETAKAG
jgi:hypothetical protein